MIRSLLIVILIVAFLILSIPIHRKVQPLRP